MRRAFKALRLRLAACDLDHKTAARICGISPGSLSARVNGRYPFTIPEAAALARVLDIPAAEWPKYFMGEDA